MKETPSKESPAFLGRGWAFPPRFDRRAGHTLMASEADDIDQSLRILLSTRLGERVMHPTFGCSIHQLVFGPMSQTTLGQIRDAIERAILFFEPRIKLDRVEVTTPRFEEGIMDILIEYTIRLTNTRSNMVFPFYFEEGTQLER